MGSFTHTFYLVPESEYSYSDKIYRISDRRERFESVVIDAGLMYIAHEMVRMIETVNGPDYGGVHLEGTTVINHKGADSLRSFAIAMAIMLDTIFEDDFRKRGYESSLLKDVDRGATKVELARLAGFADRVQDKKHFVYHVGL